MTEFTRDEMGRFASASTANGGGANFPAPYDPPSTRDALMKHATSRPSRAPRMTSRAPEIPAPDFSAPPGLLRPAAGGSWGGHGGGTESGGESSEAPEPDFSRAHDAMGYGNQGHPGEFADDLSDRLTPHDPDETPAGTGFGGEGGAPDAVQGSGFLSP